MSKFYLENFVISMSDIFGLTNSLQPIVHGYPWGSKDASNSDPYTEGPNTGVVRSYDFTITRGILSPDGFEKSIFLVNGQFPGVTFLDVHL